MLADSDTLVLRLVLEALHDRMIWDNETAVALNP
jgi:hypothetical protein